MEISARHEEHGDLYWFRPPGSKTLRPIWYWNYVESHLPTRRAHRPPYIVQRPWATSQFPSILVGYNKESFIRYVLSCTPSYLHVLGPTCQVGQDPLTGRWVFW
jgi:hypothetical protein